MYLLWAILLRLKNKDESYANEPDVHLSERAILIENVHNSKGFVFFFPV